MLMLNSDGLQLLRAYPVQMVPNLLSRHASVQYTVILIKPRHKFTSAISIHLNLLVIPNINVDIYRVWELMFNKFFIAHIH